MHTHRLTLIQLGCETCRGNSAEVHIGSVQPWSTTWPFRLCLYHQHASFLLSVSLIWHPFNIVHYHYAFLAPSSLLFFVFILWPHENVNFYTKIFASLGVQSTSSKNPLKAKSSSATSRFYIWQKVTISRWLGLNGNMISQNANVLLLSKGENINQKSWYSYIFMVLELLLCNFYSI